MTMEQDPDFGVSGYALSGLWVKRKDDGSEKDRDDADKDCRHPVCHCPDPDKQQIVSREKIRTMPDYS